MNNKVPQEYQWLFKVKELPKITQIFLDLYGLKEVPGAKSNPEILRWAKVCGLEKEYVNDGIAWCGLLMAYECHMADKPTPHGPLYALNWRTVGIEVQPGDERLGDIYVKERRNDKGVLLGGHVGQVIAQDATHLHIGGGNQGDTICIARFSKEIKHWVRRFVYNEMPAGAQVYKVSSVGAVAGKLV